MRRRGLLRSGRALAIGLAILLVPALLAPMTAGLAGTEIANEAAKAKLLGPLRLSLQWIGFGNFETMGRATVEEHNGALYLSGRQDGAGDSAGDWLALEGDILAVGEREFRFKGWVETRVSYLAGGELCRRKIDGIFLMKPGKKYWRLQAMENPCAGEGTVDYIDLFPQ